MKSLRSRLTLAFAVVAAAPLAVAFALFGPRVEAAFDAQANDRLDAGIERLEARFHAEAARLEAGIATLARDPQLRRLHLLGDSRAAELGEFLEAQRRLLGLAALRIEPAGSPESGARLAPDGDGFALVASAAVSYRGDVVARVVGVMPIDSLAIARMEAASGVRFRFGDAGAGPRTLPGRTFRLAVGGAPQATLTAFVPAADAERERRALRSAGLALAALGMALAALLGLALSRQVSAPVERLAAFAERVARGEWEKPLQIAGVREIEVLAHALERMRADLAADRERLRASERQAAYGEMARKVAHEIKNPLTPIAISIEDLRRSFEQNRPEFPEVLRTAVRVIGEEIAALQRLIREFSEFGRFREAEFGTLELAPLFAELGDLFAHEARAGRLAVEPADGATVVADRARLRQALINLVQNGLDAAHTRVTLRVRREPRFLAIEVEDDGPGMTGEQRARLFVPGFTTKAGGSGLGLAIALRTVAEHGGVLAVRSSPGDGATFTIRLPRREGD